MKLLALLLLTLLPACMLPTSRTSESKLPPAPTDMDLLIADIGKAPDEAHAQEAIKKYVLPQLKDPESARFTFRTIRRGSYFSYLTGAWIIAWVSVVEINAKNSYGGYVGAREWDFFWGDRDHLVAISAPEEGVYGSSYMGLVELEKPRAAAARAGSGSQQANTPAKLR